MNGRRFAAVAFLLAVAASARAHHIWLIPDGPNDPKVKAVFSDYLEPDGSDLLDKVAHTKLWVRDRGGKEAPLAWKKGSDSFHLAVPGEGERTVGGECVYGVETYDHRLRKKVEPYLLAYYPKAVVGLAGETKPWDRLTLEIVPAVSGDEVRFRVLFRGKPAPNAEFLVHPPEGEREDFKTDDKGEIKVTAKKGGVYGFRTRVVEEKAGEHAGKKYGAVRHYASLVLHLGAKPVSEKK